MRPCGNPIVVGVALVAALAAGCRTTASPRAVTALLPAIPSPAAVAPEDQALYREAVAMMEAGRLAEAEPLLQEMICRAPELPGPYLNLGILYERTGRLAAAEGALLQAVERDPTNAVARNELGVVLREAGQFAAALATYRAALDLDPTYANAHYNLAVLYDLYLQQPADALRHYREYQRLAAEEDPQVAMWITDLSRRVAATQATAEANDP